jgi:prepilin-type N-terminal cleavage/methylation domain-containing protein
MRPSDRTTTDARASRRGHTLVEVMIAMSVLAIVLGVALQQLNDSVQASTYSTVQADLRRIGQDILARIAQDIRSSQAQYCSVAPTAAAGAGIGTILDIQRVNGYDWSTATLKADTDSSGNSLIIRYSSLAPPNFTTSELDPRSGNQYGVLTLYKGTSAYYTGITGGGSPTATAGGVRSILTRELSPPDSGSASGGFQVLASDQTSPFTTSNAFGTSSGTYLLPNTKSPMALTGAYVPQSGTTAATAFADHPILVAVLLSMRRRTGNNVYVTMNMETQAELKPSYKY